MQQDRVFNLNNTKISKLTGSPPELNAVYFQDNPRANAMRQEMIRNQVRVSECVQGPLEEIFFSNENIEMINKMLIYMVFKKTDGLYKISSQSPQSLIIVMRYVFIENARYLPYDIKGQIKELNNIVIGEILPTVITNVQQRIGYLKDIENPLQLIALPMNTSYNAKDLPSVSTILFDK
jgi:hypothetical protein